MKHIQGEHLFEHGNCYALSAQKSPWKLRKSVSLISMGRKLSFTFHRLLSGVLEKEDALSHIIGQFSSFQSVRQEISKMDANEYQKLVWVPWKINFFCQYKLDRGHQIYFTQLSRKSTVYNNLTLLPLWTAIKHALGIRDCKFFSLVSCILSVYFI